MVFARSISASRPALVPSVRASAGGPQMGIDGVASEVSVSGSGVSRTAPSGIETWRFSANVSTNA